MVRSDGQLAVVRDVLDSPDRGHRHQSLGSTCNALWTAVERDNARGCGIAGTRRASGIDDPGPAIRSQLEQVTAGPTRHPVPCRAPVAGPLFDQSPILTSPG